MLVECARIEDETAIKALLAGCELPHADLTPAHLADFWVAHDGGELAGVVGLEVRGAAGLLRSLAVAPGRREQGLGRRLADQAEAAARDRGVRELYLLTTTAEAFFARRGFERADRASAPPDLQATAEFHSLCPSSAVCMRKRLV